MILSPQGITLPDARTVESSVAITQSLTWLGVALALVALVYFLRKK